MMDTQAKLAHSRIWGLLSDYADIRDELDDAFCSIRLLYEELGSALDDIGSELEDIEAHILSVSGSLRRFRGNDTPEATPSGQEDDMEGLPWN